MEQNKVRIKSNILLFLLLAMSYNLADGLAHPVTPTLIKDLGFGDALFGFLMTAKLITDALFCPFWGKINSYISSKTTLLICCIGCAIGQTIFGLAQTEWMMIAGRAFTGIFAGGIFVSMFTYITNTAQEEIRGKTLAFYASSLSVGGAFGYFVGGLIGNTNAYYSIVAQVILLLLVGVGFFFVCEKDAVAGVGRLSLGTIVRETNPVAIVKTAKSIFSKPLAALFAMIIMTNLGYMAFDQCLNYYMKDQLLMEPIGNGTVKFAVGLITLAVNSTISIWLMQKTDTKRSVKWILLSASVVLSCLIFPRVAWAFIAVCLVFYAIQALNMPITQHLVSSFGQTQGREKSNAIIGFYNAMSPLGGIVGSFFAGIIYTFNPIFPFLMAAGAYLVAAGISILYRRLFDRMMERRERAGTEA